MRPGCIYGSRPKQRQRFALRHSIRWGGRAISVVILRWPSLEQMQQVNRFGMSYAHAREFIGAMVGLPPEAVDLMDTEDIFALRDAIAKFTGFGGSSDEGK